jgi:hypothetical protein
VVPHKISVQGNSGIQGDCGVLGYSGIQGDCVIIGYNGIQGDCGAQRKLCVCVISK